MRNRKDHHLIRRDNVEEGVRELEQDFSPDLPSDHGRVVGKLLDETDGFASGGQKPITDARTDLVVVIDGFGLTRLRQAGRSKTSSARARLEPIEDLV